MELKNAFDILHACLCFHAMHSPCNFIACNSYCDLVFIVSGFGEKHGLQLLLARVDAQAPWSLYFQCFPHPWTNKIMFDAILFLHASEDTGLCPAASGHMPHPCRCWPFVPERAKTHAYDTRSAALCDSCKVARYLLCRALSRALYSGIWKFRCKQL